MKESDWKKFKVIKQLALDAYCKSILDEAENIMAKSSVSSHDRYIALYKHIRKKDKRLAYAFDGHSRSRAPLQLMLLRKMNLVSAEAVSKLSTELQVSSKPYTGTEIS